MASRWAAILSFLSWIASKFTASILASDSLNDQKGKLMKELYTSRLHLRPFSTNDAADFHRVIYSDPDVCHFFCGSTKTLDEVRERIAYRIFQLSAGDLGALAVVRSSDNALMGLVALQLYVASWIRWEDAPNELTNRVEVELSYALGRPFWRQGYAAEACRAVIDYAFTELGLARLAYAVDRQNAPSIALMRHLGFCLGTNLHPNVDSNGADSVVGVLVNPLGQAQ